MAQIKNACSVTNGSQVVQVSSLDLSGRIKANYIFMVEGELVPYTIAADSTYSATTGTTVLLTGAYQGPTKADAAGVFVTDFTYPNGIPTLAQGDVGTAAVFTQAMYRLQAMVIEVGEGVPGTPGSTWYNGVGTPTLPAAPDGDFYLDAATGDVYRKNAGVWAIVLNLKGPKGDKGDPAAPGAAGQDGVAIAITPVYAPKRVAEPIWQPEMVLAWDDYDIIRVTLGGATRFINYGAVDGQNCTLELKQDGAGNHDVTWPDTARFSLDIPLPSLTATAGKMDRIGFVYNASAAKYDCVAVVRGF